MIKVFDPSATAELPQQSKRTDRSTPGRRVTDLLRGRDVRRGVLVLLRDAEEPIHAGDMSKQFVEREGFGSEIAGIGPNLAGRFSGLLERGIKLGRPLRPTVSIFSAKRYGESFDRAAVKVSIGSW